MKGKDDPSSKYWKNKATGKWRERVFERDRFRCQICGATNRLNCHHVITASANFFRHNVLNGIALCPRCHTFNWAEGDGKISAHGTPSAFTDWMEENRPEQFAWWMKNRHAVTAGVKINYKEVYEQLCAMPSPPLVKTGPGGDFAHTWPKRKQQP